MRIETLIASARERLDALGGRWVRPAGFAAALAIAACATTSAPGHRLPVLPPPPTPLELAQAFALEAPPAEALGPDLKLWATHYRTPLVRAAAVDTEETLPLLNRAGEAISPPLSRRDWCAAALEGSVAVRAGARTTSYAFVDSGGEEQVNCDDRLGDLPEPIKIATRRARFQKVGHALGCGARDIPLAPFRTIAVDPDLIPLESVIYVPSLRGREFTLDGKSFVHDGYLFAGDRGGAITGRHIDVFVERDMPWEDLFASTSRRTFEARLVADTDPASMAVRQALAGVCED
jgi:3D (Asp-Asp-Asp) domain-containing protein